MKKIFLTLLALVGTMSMNAQIIEVMKNGQDTPVETYNGSDYYVVFKEAPATTGTEKATIGGEEVDVKWVQLWAGGPKFAEYNVGATSATEYGGYYTWGGTFKNAESSWQDDHNEGADALSGDNDTATNLWGSKWRMPTQAELEGLLANCEVEWTNVNGVNGRKFTGKGDYLSNSVFLPAAGTCLDGNVSGQGGNGDYWSSSPGGSGYYACDLYFGSGSQFVYDDGHRYCGCSVRAVLAEE